MFRLSLLAVEAASVALPGKMNGFAIDRVSEPVPETLI
jgi:hypothetical protein